jgi:hypothetical protein
MAQGLGAWLGAPPEELSWKALSKQSSKQGAIERYLAMLKLSEALGAQMAVRFLDNLHKKGIEGNEKNHRLAAQYNFICRYPNSTTGMQSVCTWIS